MDAVLPKYTTKGKCIVKWKDFVITQTVMERGVIKT